MLPRSPTPSPETVLTLWTADPVLAGEADAAGVDRVGVDLERVGKAERQRGQETWLSKHCESDLDGVVAVLRRGLAFARINPVHADTRREVESVIRRGAKAVMLPMVATRSEAAQFAELVAGRAVTILLVERSEALDRVPELVDVEGVDEVHVGLNDLALSLGLRTRWLALADERMVEVGAVVRDAGRRFGLGGIGRALDATLPVPSDLVYAQYARTGATAALLARSFLSTGSSLRTEVVRARARLAYWRQRTADELDAAHAELVACAARLIEW